MTFQKGDISWIKGRFHTGEDRLKMSLRKLQSYSEGRFMGFQKGNSFGCLRVKIIDVRPSFSLGYVLGAILGDGSCSKIRMGKIKGCKPRFRYNVYIGVKDEDFIDAFILNAESLGVHCYRYFKSKEGIFAVYITSRKLFEFIKGFDFNFSDKEMIIGFLRGFYDAEGCFYILKNSFSSMIALKNKNKSLVCLCKDLLLLFGVHSSSISKTYGSSFNPNGIYYGLVVSDKRSVKNFFKFIGFSIRRKQEKFGLIPEEYFERKYFSLEGKSGVLNPMYGRRQSEKTKRILSLQKLGSKNPNYGKPAWNRGLYKK